MTVTRIALAAALVVVFFIFAGYGYVLKRDRQLCLARHCVLLADTNGVVFAKQETAKIRSQYGRTSRDYVEHGSEGFAIRREWDADDDGVFECREDFYSPGTADFPTCVSQWVDGKWTCERQVWPSCGFGCRFNCARDAGF